MRKRLIWILAVVATATFQIGCDAAEQEKSKRKTTERRAQLKAADDAERALFSSAEMAEAEITRRLARVITVRDGMFLVREGDLDPRAGDSWHALPITAQWHASCTGGWLAISIGPKDKDGDVVSIADLTRTTFLDADCQRLVLAAGRAMTRMSRH